MNYNMRVLLVFLFLSIQVHGQKPAAIIPDFDFYHFDKTVFTNKNIQPGKPVFFIFFDSDCEHCQRAMKQLSDNFEQYKKAAIYLITLDGQEKVKTFFTKFALRLIDNKHITVLQDTKYEFISRFGPKKIPFHFLIFKGQKIDFI